MQIEFEDETIELNEGEMYVVPAGKRHKPFAPEEAKIMLVEPKGVVNTGEEVNDLTAENDKWVYCYSGKTNRSSTEHLSVLAIFNAKTVDGTYTPFSIELMLTLETPAFSESACWVKPADIRIVSKLFSSFL